MKRLTYSLTKKEHCSKKEHYSFFIRILTLLKTCPDAERGDRIVMKDVIAQRHAFDRRKRIDNILGAARKMFLKRGYENTTIRDICKQSRLSNGAVYFYFSSKDDIYARIYEESFHLLIDCLNRAATKKAAPMNKIEAILKSYLSFYVEHNDHWNILDISFKRLKLPQHLVDKFDICMEQAFVPLYRAVTDYLAEKKMTDRFDPLEISILLVTSIDGIFYNHRQGFFKKILENTDLRLNRLVETQIHIFKQLLQ